jgi:hypothetical protein
MVGKQYVGSRDLILAVLPTPLQVGMHTSGGIAPTLGSTPVPSAAKVDHFTRNLTLTMQDGQEVVKLIRRTAPSSASKGKKGASSSGQLVDVGIEQNWMAEHANQVHRMLPGGLGVLGFYIFCPDSGFTSASQQLCSAFSDFLEDSSATQPTAATSSSSNSSGEASTFLLLHVDSSVKKYNMKSCPIPSHGSALATNLKPCELKFGSWVNNLVCLRTTQSICWSFPAASSKAQLQQVIEQLVNLEADRVVKAVAAMQGQLYPLTSNSSSSSTATSAVQDILPSSSISEPVFVDLFSPPSACCSAGATATVKVQPSYGSSSLTGDVAAIAYVHKRDSTAKALEDLKADVCKTLQVRLELLADEAADAAAVAAEEEEEQQVGGQGACKAGGEAAAAHPLLKHIGSSKRVAVAFPRRVLLPWVAGVKVSTEPKKIEN